MKKTELSCGIIVFDGDKVLIVKHKGGHTSFPKGHKEKGENLRETAIREVKEDTGIDAEIESNICFINTYDPNERIARKNKFLNRDKVFKDVLLFIGKKTGGELNPQLEEVSYCDFFTKEEALEKLTYPIDREMLEKAYKLRDGE